MISQGQQDSINLFQTIAEQLAARLKPKTKTYFLPLILGVLLAFHRRRTVLPEIKRPVFAVIFILHPVGMNRSVEMSGTQQSPHPYGMRIKITAEIVTFFLSG